MDWKNLKDQATVWGTRATEMAKKGFETSKEYAEKTGEFTYAKLKESKFTLKDTAEYRELEQKKRFVIFCIRDSESFTKFFLAMLPVLLAKTWIESGSLRIIIEEGSDELRTALNITHIPSVFMKTNDGTIKKITVEDDIRAFIKNFSLYS
ncbi:MAG: hypothetical protein PHH70_01725 [Candidatus Gracilibacteria bacterium]|nr:hypothetical protein [Candidatus Gracilibacteria bacterium]